MASRIHTFVVHTPLSLCLSSVLVNENSSSRSILVPFRWYGESLRVLKNRHVINAIICILSVYRVTRTSRSTDFRKEVDMQEKRAC